MAALFLVYKQIRYLIPQEIWRDVLDTSRAGRENTRPPHYGVVDANSTLPHNGYSEMETWTTESF